MKKFISFCIFVLFTKVCYGIDVDALIDNAIVDKPRYLYLKYPSQIQDVDTITYYFTNDVPDYRIIEQFYIFSEKLGKKHGGVILPENSVDYEGFQSKMTTCKNEQIKPPMIMYEDKYEDKCFKFSIKDEVIFFDILSDIERRVSYKIDLKDKIQLTYNDKSDFIENMYVFYDFINYLDSMLN